MKLKFYQLRPKLPICKLVVDLGQSSKLIEKIINGYLPIVNS